MRFRSLCATAVLMVLSLMAGCATIKQYPNVVIYGSGISVDRVTNHTLPGGERQVVVFARSSSQLSKPIRYRGLWNDDQNRPIQSTLSNWVEMTISPRRTFNMTLVGPGARATGYKVEIEVLE